MPSPVPDRHKGKTVVITGGARGIGFAYAKRFMAEGAKIVIGDVLDKEGEAAVAELGKGNAIYRHCDVTKKADQEALMDAAVSTFGGLDVLIANAGIVTHGGFLDVTEEDWDRTMAINVKGVFLSGQCAAKRMIASGKGGAIINIASVNSILVQHGSVPYPASKGAVSLLTKVMAVSLADNNIRVLAIGPGPTKTAMEAAVMADPKKRWSREIRTPLRRLAEVEEVAAVASFLASDDAGYMTGQTVYVDGGRLALNYMMPEK